LIKDSEAMYLISQFNTYASWSSRGTEMDVASAAAMIACVGLFFSIFQVMDSAPSEPPLASFRGMFLFLFLAVLFGLVLMFYLQSRKILRSVKSDSEKLRILESHRQEHHSFPDNLTFEAIVTSKPEDLRTLLKVTTVQSPTADAPTL